MCTSGWVDELRVLSARELGMEQCVGAERVLSRPRLKIPKRAKNAGITLKSEPRDTEWKGRAFEVSDPSGFLLTIYSEASA